jgi:hypothetical protein
LGAVAPLSSIVASFPSHAGWRKHVQASIRRKYAVDLHHGLAIVADVLEYMASDFDPPLGHRCRSFLFARLRHQFGR